jgi:glycosyltransferase involved in cell wall biosynthesis
MRICLIGVTHPCHNPRLVREADSLADLGHDVRVIAPSFLPELARLDMQLMSKRHWRLQQVRLCSNSAYGRFSSFRMRARRRLASAAFNRRSYTRFAEWGASAAAGELRKLAISESADWFIAHTQAALPAAAMAAQFWKAQLAVDCEDLLTARDSVDGRMVRVIEKAYLPLCRYVSVPSPAIAAQLQREYKIGRPTVLYNVFPLQLASELVPPRERSAGPRLRLHWVGQTIGPDKGIEDAFEAVALLGEHAELHIRGRVAHGCPSLIHDLERRYGINVKLYPLVHHDNLVKTLGEFDVGLALERPQDGMYSVTVTNKLFLYLLAGLAVAATDTVGQREVLEQIATAGFLYPAGKADVLADKLSRWALDRRALVGAQQAAWNAARSRFCWEIERAKFLQLVDTEQNVANIDVAATNG